MKSIINFPSSEKMKPEMMTPEMYQIACNNNLFIFFGLIFLVCAFLLFIYLVAKIL